MPGPYTTRRIIEEDSTALRPTSSRGAQSEELPVATLGRKLPNARFRLPEPAILCRIVVVGALLWSVSAVVTEGRWPPSMDGTLGPVMFCLQALGLSPEPLRGDKPSAWRFLRYGAVIVCLGLAALFALTSSSG